jgi:hypothetical protein
MLIFPISATSERGVWILLRVRMFSKEDILGKSDRYFSFFVGWLFKG